MDSPFNTFLEQLRVLHERKRKDYGAPGDPMANVRASEAWGISPWVGAMVRLNDKVVRLQQHARGQRLANESAIDSFLDIAVYAGIAYQLYVEEQQAKQPPKGDQLPMLPTYEDAVSSAAANAWKEL